MASATEQGKEMAGGKKQLRPGLLTVLEWISYYYMAILVSREIC